jgi:hypothetical protein
MGDDGPIGRMRQDAALRHWRRAAQRAETAPLAALRDGRARALPLHRALGQFLAVADRRLAADATAAPEVAVPGTDWAWRPEAWRAPLASASGVTPVSGVRLGDDLALFHDCPLGEIAIAQDGPWGQAGAPCALAVEVFGFAGSYLSLAIDLPGDAAEGLLRRHVVRAALALALEEPLAVYARLNIRHGPNTEQILREVPVADAPAVVEFDLAYSALNEKRVERLWLDLIFERPAMNRIALGDVVLSRHPRAAL